MDTTNGIPEILVTETRPQMDKEEKIHIDIVERQQQAPSNGMDSDLRDNARSSFISTNSSGTSGTSEADDSNYRDSVISFSSLESSDRNSVFLADGTGGVISLGRAGSTRSMPERAHNDSDGSEDGHNVKRDIARKTLTRKTAIRRTHTLTPASSPKVKERRNRSISSTDNPLTDMQKAVKEFLTLSFDLRFYKQVHKILATPGLTLREAIRPILTDADIDIRTIDIFIESSTSATPLEFPVHPLSGRHLHVRAKAGKVSKTVNSPNFSRKKMDDTENGDTAGDVLGKSPMRKDMSKFLGVEQTDLQPSPPRQPSSQPHEQKKKDLTKLLGINQEEPTKNNRRISVTGTQQTIIKDPAKEKVDPKFLKLQQTLENFMVFGLPDFPSLLTFTTKREDDHECFELEDSWRAFGDEDQVCQLTKKETDQQEAIWEIIKTEVGYIKNIRIIVDFYLCTLINLQASVMLNEIETEKIFSNITAIEKLHTRFWKEKLSNVVKEARDKKRLLSAPDLSEAFSGFADLFAPYIKFCTDEHECMKYLRERTKENEMLRFFIEWAQRHPNSRRLKLQDLLVYPMQRITKYPLLLIAVEKKTLEEHELAGVSARIAEVKEFVMRVNHELRQEQERQKMEDAIAHLEAYEAVSVPSGCDELSRLVEEHATLDLMSSMPNAPPAHARWLHMKGSLKLRDADNSSKDAYGFLFTDMFILAKQRKSENFRIIKPPMRVDMIKVQELKDGSGFALVHLDEYDCAVYGCVLSTTVAPSWLQNIRAAKELYNKLCNFEAEYQTVQELDDGSGEPPTSPEAMVFSLQSNAFPFMDNSPSNSPLNSPKLPGKFLSPFGMQRVRSSSSLTTPSGGVSPVPEENGEEGEENAVDAGKEEVSTPGGADVNPVVGSTEDILSALNNNSRTTFPPSKRQSQNEEGLRQSGLPKPSPSDSPTKTPTKSANISTPRPSNLSIPQPSIISSSPVSPNSIMAFDDSEDEDTGMNDFIPSSPKRKVSSQITINTNTLKKAGKTRRKTAPGNPNDMIKPKDVTTETDGKSRGKSKMKYFKKLSNSKS